MYSVHFLTEYTTIWIYVYLSNKCIYISVTKIYTYRGLCMLIYLNSMCISKTYRPSCMSLIWRPHHQWLCNASTPTELYFPVIWLLIVLKNLCSSFLMARSWISINLMQSGRWCGPSVHDRVTSRAWDFSAFKFQIHLYDSLYSKALTGP